MKQLIFAVLMFQMISVSFASDNHLQLTTVITIKDKPASFDGATHQASVALTKTLRARELMNQSNGSVQFSVAAPTSSYSFLENVR